MKFIDILKEAISRLEYSDNSNTWTHVTNRDETIDQIKSKKLFLGPNEDTSEFNYEINKGISANKQNTNVPNFYRGKIYPGGFGSKYLITLKPKQSYPGDDFESQNWKDVDYPFIPNSNRANKISFKKSGDVGVLKPEYRDIDNFKFYRYDDNSKKYIEFDI